MGPKPSKEDKKDMLGDIDIEENIAADKSIPSMKIDSTNFTISTDREAKLKSVFYDSKNNSISADRTIEMDTPSKKIIENIIEQEFFTIDSKSSNSFNNSQDSSDNLFWKKLPLGSSQKVIEFLIDELDVMLTVSKKWSKRIKKILNLKLSRVNNSFYRKYRNSVDKVTTGLSLRRIHSVRQPSWKSEQQRAKIRFDLVLRCKIGSKLKHRRVMLSYKYKLKSRKNKIFYSNYIFDVHKKGKSRQLWVMKEERRRSDNGQILDYIPVQPLNPGDWVQIAVNIWSPEGLVDVDSIEWLPMRIGHVYNPGHYYENPGKKDPILCRLEHKISWNVVSHDPREILLPKNFLYPCFERVGFKSSGLEVVHVKGIFRAVKQGMIRIKNSRSRKSQLKIMVVEGDACVVNVNKVGLMGEFNNSLSLKLGDILVFYLSLV